MAGFNPRKMITDRIIELMTEHGTDWIKPFGGLMGLPRSVETDKPYRGINTILLWSEEYADPRWGTYKAWKRRGAQVRKGEKSTRISYYGTAKTESEEGKEESFKFLKLYSVFNAEQVDGVESLDMPEMVDETEVLEEVDALLARAFENMGVTVVHSDSGAAYYRPTSDTIHMPERQHFIATKTSSATENYYSTKCHEGTHATGHESRLDRLGSYHKNRDRAFEELIAEIGAAYLCVELGISVEPRADHAKYLNGWLQALSNDVSYITRAATAASKAVDFLLNAADQDTAKAA